MDNSIMYANTLRYSADTGHFFENMVFNELINKGYTNISFDNTKRECDFLAWKDGELHAFQACYELTDGNRMRELTGLTSTHSKPVSRTIITFNQKEEDGDIRIVPLWEWTLAMND